MAAAQGRQPKLRCPQRARRPQRVQSSQRLVRHHVAGRGRQTAEGRIPPMTIGRFFLLLGFDPFGMAGYQQFGFSDASHHLVKFPVQFVAQSFDLVVQVLERMPQFDGDGDRQSDGDSDQSPYPIIHIFSVLDAHRGRQAKPPRPSRFRPARPDRRRSVHRPGAENGFASEARRCRVGRGVPHRPPRAGAPKTAAETLPAARAGCRPEPRTVDGKRPAARQGSSGVPTEKQIQAAIVRAAEWSYWLPRIRFASLPPGRPRTPGAVSVGPRAAVPRSRGLRECGSVRGLHPFLVDPPGTEIAAQWVGRGRRDGSGPGGGPQALAGH